LFVERCGASWVDAVEHEEGCLVKCIGVLIHSDTLSEVSRSYSGWTEQPSSGSLVVAAA
jgi:hypothetical protein